jgi:RNA polymerase sigma-70 factor (ECF subfamily)
METNWITAAKKGDSDAFLRLLRQYDRQVMSVIYRFSGDLYDREDLYQDIFLHAFQAIRKFRGQAAFATWLYRVALNRCLVYMRSNRLKHGSTAPIDASFDQLESDGEKADASLEQHQRMLAVQQAMQKLKGPQRICFHLYYIEEWDHDRIAATLAISTNTVKSHLHRARTKVRDSQEVAQWLISTH